MDLHKEWRERAILSRCDTPISIIKSMRDIVEETRKWAKEVRKNESSEYGEKVESEGEVNDHYVGNQGEEEKIDDFKLDVRLVGELGRIRERQDTLFQLIEEILNLADKEESQERRTKQDSATAARSVISTLATAMERETITMKEDGETAQLTEIGVHPSPADDAENSREQKDGVDGFIRDVERWIRATVLAFSSECLLLKLKYQLRFGIKDVMAKLESWMCDEERNWSSEVARKLAIASEIAETRSCRAAPA